MQTTIDDEDWDYLLTQIKEGKCTPFLGAGACYGALPLGGEVAHQWSKKYDYPLEDSGDLSRVAQYLAVRRYPMFPKIRLLREFATKLEQNGVPDFEAADEPHGVLADLPLPVYITTNYDPFMSQALEARNKCPRRELCRWNRSIKTGEDEDERLFKPDQANPLVFHLHGHDQVPESLVLTEDDYLEFLVKISQNQQLLPPRIQRAMTGASLLFIGYSLRDWTFRVLYRGLVASMERSLRGLNISVQLSRGRSPEEQAYLEAYFEDMDVRIYWGTAREFAQELRERWTAFSHDV